MIKRQVVNLWVIYPDGYMVDPIDCIVAVSVPYRAPSVVRGSQVSAILRACRRRYGRGRLRRQTNGVLVYRVE